MKCRMLFLFRDSIFALTVNHLHLGDLLCFLKQVNWTFMTHSSAINCSGNQNIITVN